MRRNFVDCFMLMNTALSISGGKRLNEMGRPISQDVYTTFINASVTVDGIKIVDITHMKIQVSLHLHQRWIDSRLGANLKTRKMAITGQIWKPKVTNINGMAAHCCDNTEDNTFWRGYGVEGRVLLSEKKILNIFCTTNFKEFPFDTQLCKIKFGTYRFPTDEVELLWHSNPFELIDTNIDDFKLINISTYASIEKRPSGNFSVLVLELAIKRCSFKYVLNTAVPCLLAIILCYMTFWIQIVNCSARYLIITLSLAILLYVYYSSTCALQSVLYLTSSDVFVLACISFAMFSFLETFFVDVLSAKSTDVKIKKGAFRQRYPKSVIWLERCSRLLFPVQYLIFAVFYCIVYVN